MRYLSVCSGIEAASVAWHPLGFAPAAFAEVDKFPAAVLASRFPNVPNLGDMNGYAEWKLDPIDVLVGGTPCQSFSVAGLRKGLADARGNLALVYCRLLERFRPKWFVWENVPGVLSSGRGRDFGSFLGAVAQLGYGFAYRVLDAQFFGVPQRRRRVFVVGCLGDWRRSAAVLFERESLLGNSAKGRSPKQEIAKTLRGRANSSHREDSDNFITHSLRGEGFDASEDGTGRGTPLVPTLSHACLAKGGSGRLDPTCETFIACTLPASNGGVSSGMHPVVAFSSKDYAADAGPVSPTLRAMGHSGSHANAGGQVAVAFAENSRAEIRLEGGDGNRTGALSTGGGKPGQGTPMIQQAMQVRRLTPRECERLQGFPDDWTAIEYRGKPACDGPRYKAIGNSMAVPVMRWIGERLSVADLI